MDTLLNRAPTDNDIKNRCNGHQCSCCGSCCTEFLPLTRKEIYKIKDYLKEHPEIKGNWLTKDEDKDLHAFCPFLNKDTCRCDIYPVRPFVCRDFKCDKSIDKIKANRLAYAKRADYNSFLKEDDVMVSLHYLFFNDYQFDFTYRHLAAKSFGVNLTFEQEQELLPMFVDSLIKDGC